LTRKLPYTTRLSLPFSLTEERRLFIPLAEIFLNPRSSGSYPTATTSSLSPEDPELAKVMKDECYPRKSGEMWTEVEKLAVEFGKL
jgi:hypothetical protein